MDYKELQRILQRFKASASKTECGSCYVWNELELSICLTGKSYLFLNDEEKKKYSSLLHALRASRILWGEYIIPAPFLENEFIEKLAPPEEVKIEES